MKKQLFKPIPIDPEPKRNNMFIVELPDIYFEGIPSYLVQKVSLPSLKNGVWENIKIEFLEFLDSPVSRAFYILANRRKNNIDCSFEFIIKSIDPIGEEIEKWKITTKEIDTLNFGELDYGKSELRMLTMIVVPDTCTYSFNENFSPNLILKFDPQ